MLKQIEQKQQQILQAEIPMTIQKQSPGGVL